MLDSRLSSRRASCRSCAERPLIQVRPPATTSLDWVVELQDSPQGARAVVGLPKFVNELAKKQCLSRTKWAVCLWERAHVKALTGPRASTVVFPSFSFNKRRRSDIGEARPQGGGFGAPGRGADGDEHADYSESTFDKFSGYSENLFAGVEYDEADREADSIWAAVDSRMEERNENAREKRKRSDAEAKKKEAPKVQLMFADLTKKLGGLSEDDWMSIPEIGDTHARKSQRAERYVPVPDSMLAAAAQAETHAHSIGAGADSVLGGVGQQDLTSIGRAQQLQLDTTLARASASVAGQSVVNKTGYMTDLTASRAATDDLVDLNKARELLTNVTTTNPSHAPGWIAAARLEHIAGKISTARKIMLRGCAACAKNEDVWLEAARLHTPENAKVILARAVQNVPTSVKIWLSAAKLEETSENKKRVVRKGIEMVPKSVDLWKAAIELEEDPEDAKVLLRRAVECVPASVEMWLALAHMEPYKEARKVLNRAREAVPTDPAIWITAARLEEAQGNDKGIAMIISRAVKNLAAHNVVISRQKWLEEAHRAEKAESPRTCSAIVRETLGIGVEVSRRLALNAFSRLALRPLGCGQETNVDG